MNLSHIDLNLFTVFDVIYTERNLTKAGTVLGITQPAVSNALSRLRDSFDDQLFVRTSEGMTPTPVAENIVDPIRRALHLMRVCVQESQVFKPAEATKDFRISITDIFGAIVLPELFQVIEREAPKISITTKAIKRRSLTNELASGAIDFAVDVPLVSEEQVRHASIYAENFSCLVRKGHPALKSGLNLETYLNQRHILVSNRTKGPAFEDVALAKLGHSRTIGFRTQHYLMAPQIITQSDMLLTVSSRFAQTCVEFDERLECLPVPFPIPEMSIHIYWHASMDEDPANRWLRELIIKLLKDKLV